MRTLTSLATMFTLALGLAACGDDKEMTTATPTSDTPNPDTGSATDEPGTSTVDPPTTATEPTTTEDPPTTATETDPSVGTTVEPTTTTVDPTVTATEPGTDTNETATTVEPDTTTTDTGGADESPYQACTGDADCNGGICINSMVTGGQIKGSFCSPACTGPGKLCPDPAASVQTSQAAQCIFGPQDMPPTNCAIICSVGKDECGPESDCEDIGQAPMMGVTLGVCSTPA